MSGWHLPGGGVEAGETLAEALARELLEEGNIELTAPPRLHGMYFNDRDSRRDHVALFVVRDFRQTAAPVPDHEIIAHGFFAAERVAQRHHGRHARAHPRGARRRAGQTSGGEELPAANWRRVASLSRIAYHLSILIGQWLVADHRGGVSRGGNPSAAITQ